MNVFYNHEGIGDTLIVALQDIALENRTFDRKGDVARIYDRESNVTAGFNIFGVSSYMEIKETGNITLTKELVKKINEILAKNGFEERVEADFSPKFVVGYVAEKEKHPNADKLSICKVEVGTETLQIVCGAPNVEAGQKVVVAKIGAVMPSGMLIKPAELRGIPSAGMLCSARELELPDAPQEKGILVLEDSYEIGQEFKF
ncbi:t-RNA-binding domain protein [Bacillus cytotoxicus NVH 391-98]|uniref:T-RNA-binding domain protein n=1 Tax=Bacillus cytotoxicus (strain DSM 22905 / CIP 110041 / 391-98 / NVH 391-98) TaxID=315749 RepID=A7GTW0_BACCN|nr:t-RNA-binding domain protein [Bacillus cytotoxicus NVH 391-98]